MEIVLCEHETCARVVQPSKTTGRPRKYCSLRCQQAAATKRYRDRERSAESQSLYSADDNGLEHCSRKMPPSTKIAEKRFREHEAKCGRGEDGRCPGRNNPYSLNPDRERCIVYAVFRDDWDEIRRKERGDTPRLRTSTTRDGYWITEHWLWPVVEDMIEEGLLGEGADDRDLIGQAKYLRGDGRSDDGGA